MYICVQYVCVYTTKRRRSRSSIACSLSLCRALCLHKRLIDFVKAERERGGLYIYIYDDDDDDDVSVITEEKRLSVCVCVLVLAKYNSRSTAIETIHHHIYIYIGRERCERGVRVEQ